MQFFKSFLMLWVLFSGTMSGLIWILTKIGPLGLLREMILGAIMSQQCGWPERFCIECFVQFFSTKCTSSRTIGV